MYTQPLFLIVLSAMALKTRVRPNEILGVALGVLGVAISAVGGGVGLYDLLPILGGFIWALGTGSTANGWPGGRRRPPRQP